jgi:hypothetical protein
LKSTAGVRGSCQGNVEKILGGSCEILTVLLRVSDIIPTLCFVNQNVAGF